MQWKSFTYTSETEWYGLPAQLSWGPFTIQTSLLAVIAACAALIVAVRLVSRFYGPAAKEAAELVQNAAFIVLLVWKFGHVLFAPSVIWDRPLAIFILNGGTREALLAAAAAAVYLVVSIRRKGIPLRIFLDLVSFGTIVAVIVYAAIDWRAGEATTKPWGIVVSSPEFRYHPISGYTIIVALAVLMLLGFRRGKAGTGEWFRIATLYMGAGLLLVSFWEVPAPTVLLFTAYQWRALALVAAGIIFSAGAHTKTTFQH
ncbi:hypothetical protein [Paenibacillus ginsengarvi]|uniref:hypothetical protein n=1 Tax=Paenibacillus ginsengarvi TaxID=400777 RepID=UPI001874893A|nr:hypothetical protein [Paenibacillus ginsengarvi]